LCVGFGNFLLGQDQYLPRLCQGDGGPQTGNTGADNNKIGVLRKLLHYFKC
jgi:hypothetical protein